MQGRMLYGLCEGVVHCVDSLQAKYSKEDLDRMCCNDMLDCVNALIKAMVEMKKLEGGGDDEPMPLKELERMYDMGQKIARI